METSWTEAGGATVFMGVRAKNEAASLPELVEEIARAFRPLVARGDRGHRLDAFEVLIVDDGSTDDTAAVLRGLGEGYPELRTLTLARNAGQSAATTAG